MNHTTSRTVNEELRFLLHPADLRDVPVPGFPPHDALVAWARSKPVEEVIDAAAQILGEADWPQQYAAMGLLRALGVRIEGEGYGKDFRWLLSLPDRDPRSLEPAIDEAGDAPTGDPGSSDVDELNGVLAAAIGQLDERVRIAVTLRYYERYTFEDVATVLGTNEHEVRLLLRDALDDIRTRITPRDKARLEHLAQAASDAADRDGPAIALVREMAAA